MHSFVPEPLKGIPLVVHHREQIHCLSWHKFTWILIHRRSTVVLSASQATNNVTTTVVCTGIWYGYGHVRFLTFVPFSVKMMDYEHQLKGSNHSQMSPFFPATFHFNVRKIFCSVLNTNILLLPQKHFCGLLTYICTPTTITSPEKRNQKLSRVIL